MDNPAGVLRTFMGLGHFYGARAKGHAGFPTFLGQKSVLALIWQLGSCKKPQLPPLALQHGCTKERMHKLLHSMHLPVSS